VRTQYLLDDLSVFGPESARIPAKNPNPPWGQLTFTHSSGSDTGYLEAGMSQPSGYLLSEHLAQLMLPIVT
jgi:hypothetical protein